jgi:hypothetical protein
MGAVLSVWYQLVLLFFAMFPTRLWFVFGPSNPWHAVMVAWGTSSLEGHGDAAVEKCQGPRQRGGKGAVEEASPQLMRPTRFRSWSKRGS